MTKFLKGSYDTFEAIMKGKFLKDEELCRDLEDLKEKILLNSDYITDKYVQKEEFFENLEQYDLE